MKRHSLTLVLAGLAASLLVGVQSAHAGAYTIEADWRTAVGTYSLETFDAVLGGSDVTTLPALGIKFDPLNDLTQPTVQPYASTGGVVKSGPNNLLNDRDFSLPGRGPISVRPIAGADFIFALGLWNVGGDDKLRLSFYDAADLLIESVDSAASSGFFGIVNISGAKRAQVDFLAGNGYAPTDDWQTATRVVFDPGNPTPEPSVLALVGIGLASLGFARRRARKPS